MSTKASFDSSSNIFLIAALTLPDVKEGIAIDGLRVIFQNLHEAYERLKEKLLAVSNGSVNLDDKEPEAHIAYSSIMGDTWIIVDNIRRVQLLLDLILGIPPTILDGAFTSKMADIKDIRDSFHHINERVEQHYNTIGGSVFGELIWRYRPDANQQEELKCLISGVSRRARHIELGTWPEHADFVSCTGIYDIALMHIKKDGRKSITHSKVIVNLDDAAKHINSLIEYLEQRYSNHYKSLDLTSPVKGSGPNIISLKLSESAWEREKAKRKS